MTTTTTTPRKLPDHGTQSRYKGARNGSYPPCRCRRCIHAHTTACTRRVLAHLAGTPPLYPAEPLRQHINTLTAAGMSRDLIARRAKVSHATISYLARGLTKSCRREKALRILAVTPGDFDSGAERPVLGSMRRVRALYAIGHNPATIAAAAGLCASNISHIANGHNTTVQGPTAAAITAAYKTLSTRQGTSAKARARARANGWHGPLAWDNIDDPNATPEPDDTPGFETLSRLALAAERREQIRRLTAAGETAEDIAKQLGMNVSSVRTIRAEQRTGRKRDRTKKAAA